MNIIIITGASSGIGKEFALQLDKGLAKIDEFWLISRNKEKMVALSDELTHRTRIFDIDITDNLQVENLKKALYEQEPAVRMLINSAGYGIRGNFSTADGDKQLGMIELNCVALTNITHMCIPYMKKGSRIIQMASSAAFIPENNFAVYAASKAYVYNFSRALALELADRNIYVTSVCPGPVDTPFFDISDEGKSISGLRKLLMANPSSVVKKALLDSYKKKEISVYGFGNKLFKFATGTLPENAMIKLSSRFNKM